MTKNKEVLMRLFDDYINSPKQLDLKLIEEFRYYSTRGFQQSKIQRVYIKLLKAKKYSIAKRMQDKYSSILNFKSDRLMAFSLCLQNQKI